jgi:hypothetical protein
MCRQNGITTLNWEIGLTDRGGLKRNLKIKGAYVRTECSGSKELALFGSPEISRV